MNDCEKPIDFGRFCKNAASVRSISFEWLPVVGVFWAPGRSYPVGAYVRPNRANGFAFMVTVSGQSGGREPGWAMEENALTNDGSVTWQAVRPASNAMTPITAPQASVLPAGELTTGGVNIIDGDAPRSRVELTLNADAIPGKTYEISVGVTAGPQTLIGVVTVEIK